MSDDPINLHDLSFQELRKVAKERDVKVPKGTNHAGLLDLLGAGPAPSPEDAPSAVVPDAPVESPVDSGPDVRPDAPTDDVQPATSFDGAQHHDTADGSALEELNDVAAVVVVDAQSVDPVDVPAPADPAGDETRLPITHFSKRGDWEDPFSGLMVLASNTVCPVSGAHREGDEAVIRHAR